MVKSVLKCYGNLLRKHKGNENIKEFQESHLLLKLKGGSGAQWEKIPMNMVTLGVERNN